MSPAATVAPRCRSTKRPRGLQSACVSQHKGRSSRKCNTAPHLVELHVFCPVRGGGNVIKSALSYTYAAI